MPAEIDVTARLTELAQATLAVAREGGPQALTIRSVASKMGGSTTLVTKFVPSRTALLRNAMRYVRRRWAVALADALDGHTGIDRVRALVNWSCDTVDDDYVVRRLWVDVLAKADSTSEELEGPREEAHEELASIRETLAESELDAPPWLADLLFLAFRGYFISSVEDQDEWPPERAQAVVNAMVDEVLLARRAA
jgi:AcrR family transcriptional regulator